MLISVQLSITILILKKVVQRHVALMSRFRIVTGYGGDEYLRYVAVATEDRGEVEERYELSIA